MENQKGFKISQYACAVLLIVSSIALVAYQVVEIDDVATGLLYYVAQSGCQGTGHWHDYADDLSLWHLVAS